MAVFAGSFDLEAATAVCAGDGIVPGQVLDEIQGLADKSLLAVERRAAATRFRMLDFVRQYASERLAAAGEGVLLADRHRAYFGELAQRADRELWALAPAGRARLDDESPNLRAAIDDGCARAPDDALAMVGALGLYWRVRGRLAEGVTAMEQSLSAAPPQPSPGRALALAKLSLLSFWLGDFARTQSSATSALEMGAAIADTRSQALALGPLGSLVILGDPGAGDPMLMRAAELARAGGDDVALCDALTPLAISYFFQDDPGAMRSPLTEALRIAEAIGFEDDIRWCSWCLAQSAFSAGDLAGARAQGERALAMMPGQDQLSRYCAVEILCLLDANMGAADAARERAEADFEQSRQERLRLGTGVLMHALGVAALAAGDLDRAEQWATSLYEQEPEVCYLAWHAQEILVAVALARDDRVQAKISVERLLAELQVIHGPRRARPGTYDAWVTAMQSVDPHFEFTDPPFRHSLAVTLALAAAGNRPAAVLTGPTVAAHSQASPIRRSHLADTYGMVRVSLQHHPLTASAALVWSGDLPRPLQQILFDIADSLTEPAHQQPADLVSLTTARAARQSAQTS